MGRDETGIHAAPQKKRISTASAKDKGRRLQKWVCERISDLLGLPFGPDECIASREMGQSGCDVRLVGPARRFHFSIECKYQESWALPSWIKQAQANEEPDRPWLLFCKRNRQDPVVVLDAVVFFELMKRGGGL